MKNRKLYALVAGGVTVALLGGLLAVTTLAADPIPTVTFNEDTRKFEFRNVSNNNTKNFSTYIIWRFRHLNN